MSKTSIKVFARIKPEIGEDTVKHRICKRPKDYPDEDLLILSSPRKFGNEHIDNRPESWNFSFYKIFDGNSEQRDIFNDVARPVVHNLFEGYNGTIFAYGQTGSGKTYAITGEPENSVKQGILPRTLNYIFETIEENSNDICTVELSYLEIYNENGYDLLSRPHWESVSRLDDLPRVEIREDEEGMMHLKNLKFHTVKNAREAMDLLLIGNRNRAISETPMNPLSSRSHCIFTILLKSKKSNGNHCNRAKMHLVDLAGSERVYKCAITGTILVEAKHINLSLHYLEQVIVYLGQENTSHVPYRNSLLTGILRDSLGGNCITIMLATLSVSVYNLEVIELIREFKFSQRVALIKNYTKLIPDNNIDTEIELLRIENERLKKLINELKNKQSDEINVQKESAYYKNLVLQRDQEISHLINMMKNEKLEKTKRSRDKIIETDKPKLEIRLNEVVVNIEPSISCELKSPKKPKVHSSLRDSVNQEIPKISLNPTERVVKEIESPVIPKDVETLRINLNGQEILRCPSNGKLLPSHHLPCETKTPSVLNSWNAQACHVTDGQYETPIELIGSFQKSRDKSDEIELCNERKPVKGLTFIKNKDEYRLESNKNGNDKDYRCDIENNEVVHDDFEKSLPLTGDLEIDEEIIAFYKAQRSGSYY